MKIASKANIFGAETVGLRSSTVDDCAEAGSTSVTCFFRLSTLKKLPPSAEDTLSITFTYKNSNVNYQVGMVNVVVIHFYVSQRIYNYICSTQYARAISNRLSQERGFAYLQGKYFSL